MYSNSVINKLSNKEVVGFYTFPWLFKIKFYGLSIYSLFEFTKLFKKTVIGTFREGNLFSPLLMFEQILHNQFFSKFLFLQEFPKYPRINVNYPNKETS